MPLRSKKELDRLQGRRGEQNHLALVAFAIRPKRYWIWAVSVSAAFGPKALVRVLPVPGAQAGILDGNLPPSNETRPCA
jgi:hypothetical protein